MRMSTMNDAELFSPNRLTLRPAAPIDGSSGSRRQTCLIGLMTLMRWGSAPLKLPPPEHSAINDDVLTFPPSELTAKVFERGSGMTKLHSLGLQVGSAIQSVIQNSKFTTQNCGRSPRHFIRSSLSCQRRFAASLSTAAAVGLPWRHLAK